MPYTGPPPVNLSSIAGSFMRRAPYVSTLYNPINSLAHLFNGTLGQWGPAPSIIGRITAGISGNPHNLPPGYPGSPLAPQSPNAPLGPQVTPQQFNGVFGSPMGAPAFNPQALGIPNSAQGFNQFSLLPNAIARTDPLTNQPVFNARGYIPTNSNAIAAAGEGPGMAGNPGAFAGFFNSGGSPLEREVYNRMH